MFCSELIIVLALSEIVNNLKKKEGEISASAELGPRSRVCARKTLRLAAPPSTLAEIFRRTCLGGVGGKLSESF